MSLWDLFPKESSMKTFRVSCKEKDQRETYWVQEDSSAKAENMFKTRQPLCEIIEIVQVNGIGLTFDHPFEGATNGNLI